MNKELRCVIYTRVSTDTQAEGVSLEVQEEVCRKHIVDKLGGIVVGVFHEPGKSGEFYRTRKVLQEALSFIRAKRADYFVCYDTSRLSRKSAHLGEIVELVEKVGADVSFTNFGYTKNAGGKLMLGISGVVNEYERGLTKEKAWECRVEVVKRGIQTQRSAAPYGYKVINQHDVIKGTHTQDMVGKYEVVEEEAATVRLIFELYKAGNSLRSICFILQGRGIPTPKGCRSDSKIGQRVWLASTIKAILRNPCHMGKATFGKTKTIRDEERLVEGFKRPFKRIAIPQSEWHYIDCPAIIDSHLFEYCNEQLTDSAKRFTSGTERKYMLTGLLFCAKCNRTMSPRNRRRHYHKGSEKEHVYHCKNSHQNALFGDFVCNRHVLKGRVVEARVKQALKLIADNPDWIVQAYDHFHGALENQYTEATREEVKKQIADLKRREQAVIDLQIDNKLAGRSTASLDDKLSTIDAERVGLEAKLAQIREHLISTVDRADPRKEADKLAEVLNAIEIALDAKALPEHKKHALVSTVIEKITADEQGELVVTFRPFSSTSTLTVMMGGDDIKVEYSEREMRVVR
jgi:site-specific DNA recombinase